MPLVDVPSEVLTETEIRARVLEAAALEIEVRGWSKGHLCAYDGSVCLSGAIGVAAGLAPGDIVAYEFAYQTFFGRDLGGGNRTDEVMAAIRLPMWNDEVGRTAEEVTARLRSRAAELRSI